MKVFVKWLYVNTMLTEAGTSWISLAQSPSYSSSNIMVLTPHSTSIFSWRELHHGIFAGVVSCELNNIISPTRLYSPVKGSEN